MTIWVKGGQAGQPVEYSNKAWALGDRMVPARADATTNNAVAKKWVWEVTTAGTTAATPAWPATVTQDVTTITQDGVVFTARKPGFSSGSTANWTFATPFIDYGANAAVAENVYVSNNHAATPSTNIAIATGTNTAPIGIFCVPDDTVSPTSLAETAVETTTGSITMSITGFVYCYGVTFNIGSAGNSINLTLNNNSAINGNILLERCAVNLNATGSSTQMIFGNSAGQQQRTSLRNTNLKLSNATAVITVSGRVTWDGGALTNSATMTTAPFQVGSRGCDTFITGVDFSGLPATLPLSRFNSAAFGRIIFRNIKVATDWSADAAASGLLAQSAFAEVNNASHANGDILIRMTGAVGNMREDRTIVRSGGTNDGAGYSLKVTTGAAAIYPLQPFTSPEIVPFYFATTGAKTATFDLIHDSATPINDDEVWVELNYYNTAGQFLGAIASSRRGLMSAPAPLASSSAVWVSTGMTNPNKQKITIPFTMNEPGIVQAKWCVAKPSYTVYLDGKIQGA